MSKLTYKQSRPNVSVAVLLLLIAAFAVGACGDDNVGGGNESDAQVAKAGAENLAACGLSKRKTEYILDLADSFRQKRVHTDKWAQMSDEEVISELIQIRGITRWTAEMFLIFNLLRPNVLPLDDPGLIHGISRNYFSGEPVSRSDAREVSANWEPWRTVATWYLWRSLDPVPVE